MSDGLLVIGTRRYSSWSMRGWLAVRLAGLDVTERVIPHRQGRHAGDQGGGRRPGSCPTWSTRAPWSGRRPAICEYCAECNPALWPADRVARAAARSAAAEMHAGFGALRQAMPMNLGRERRSVPAAAVMADIARIEAIWRAARQGTAFLYADAFGAADAMFAPVVARFLSYLPELSPESRAYCRAVRGHPLVAAWYDAAAEEPAAWRLAHYEDVP